MSQAIIYTGEPAAELNAIVRNAGADITPCIIADEHTTRLVVPELREKTDCLRDADLITIPAGDENKTLDAVIKVWQHLSDSGISRRSIIINVGGGMVTDLGGFAAATFKRGLRFINVPTTLLGAVDAAIGGKTGVNFNGLKNEIGSFCDACAVIISTVFFKSLDPHEFRSGYAEMVKHGLLTSRDEYYQLIDFDLANPDFDALLPLLRTSVEIKRRIVADDPYEQNLRKALNLGHTVGHAFESLSIRRGMAMPHGYAVAWGILVEMIISNLRFGFPSAKMTEYAEFLQAYYADAPGFACGDYPDLIELMRHDKKNLSPGNINFTLLSDIGTVHINQVVPDEEIKTALDIFRDIVHT